MVLVDDRSNGPQVEAAPRSERKSFKNFLPRALSVVVLAPVALGAAYVGDWPFLVLVALASAVALVEWLRITGHSETVVIALSIAALCATAGATLLGHASYALASLGPVAVGLWFLSSLRAGRGFWVAIGYLYLTVPVISLIYLREDHGFALIFWIFGIIWAMDIGAYMVGSAVGGPKLVPHLSPNKTWSGLIGGMVCAAAVSVILGMWLEVEALPHLIWSGSVLAIWSQIGDIFESSIKRRFKVKDSGHVIPGHGGVLDRIDSLAFTAPVVALVAWSL